MQEDDTILGLIDKAEPYVLEPSKPLLGAELNFQDFPVDALGEILGDAARAIHEKVQAPISICAQSVLANASLAVQHIADVELPTGQTRPLSNFFLTIAESGERKSSVDNEALKATRGVEKELREKYKQDLKEWNVKYQLWETKKKSLQRKDINASNDDAFSKHLKEEPEKPVSPIIIIDDPTIEGLVKCFNSGLSSLGMFTSEGGQFLGGYSLNAERITNTSSMLSRFWDGGSLKVIRATKEDAIIDGCMLSTHLMIQPEMARDFLTNKYLLDQGLLSRFLSISPPSAAGTRFFKETCNVATETALEKYHARIRKLLHARDPLNIQKTPQEKITLRLTDNARIIWINFSNYVEELIAPHGELEPVKGFANKLAEHAARLAGVLALIENPDCTEIGEILMDCGIGLAKFYAYELLRIKGLYQIPKSITNADKIGQWLFSHWSEDCISIPDLQQYGPNSLRHTPNEIKQTLQILEEHGFLIALPDGGTIKGNKRKEAWKIVRGQDEKAS